MPGSSTRPLQRQSTSSASLGGSSRAVRISAIVHGFPLPAAVFAALVRWLGRLQIHAPAVRSAPCPLWPRFVARSVRSGQHAGAWRITIHDSHNKPAFGLAVAVFRPPTSSRARSPSSVGDATMSTAHCSTSPSLPTGSRTSPQAVCVSECPSPPLTTPALDDDPSQYVCTGSYYGTPTDRCDSGATAAQAASTRPRPTCSSRAWRMLASAPTPRACARRASRNIELSGC